MILKARNGFVYNEEGIIVMVIINDLPDELVEDIERTVEFGSEAAPAIEKLIELVNSGSFKPRSIVKELENIANKYK